MRIDAEGRRHMRGNAEDQAHGVRLRRDAERRGGSGGTLAKVALTPSSMWQWRMTETAYPG